MRLTYLLLGYALIRALEAHMKTSLDGAHLTWPVAVLAGSTRLPGRGGSRITQGFKPGRHPGVDIAVPGLYKTARADVLAVADGRVARAYKSERGWAVLLDHGDWASGYLHLADLDGAVADGRSVVAGQRLGAMGADPLDAERIVHLHLQIAPGGIVVDPARYLPAV